MAEAATATAATPKRREWTPKMKAGVIAYYKQHGHQATRDHYRISGSMINRWRRENGASPKPPRATNAGKKMRKWTPEQKAKVLAYYAEHGSGATMKRFKTSTSMIHYWRTHGGADAPRATPGRKPLNSHMEALIHLQRWHAARLSFIRDGGEPNDYDLDVELALRALKGARK